MKLHFSTFLFLGCMLAIVGCSPKTQENKAPESPGLKPESAHGSNAPAQMVSDANLKFTAPQGWIMESPTSSNRKAQYKLPRAAGDPEDAELVVYHFGSGGGTPKANVDRWIGQFTKPDGSPASDTAKITQKSMDGMPATIVDVSGAYAGSMMSMQSSSASKPGFRMLGAIIETANGPWFIKLTGPAKTLAQWQPSFESFLDSIKQVK